MEVCSNAALSYLGDVKVKGWVVGRHIGDLMGYRDKVRLESPQQGCVIAIYLVYEQPLFYATIIECRNWVKWLIIVGFWFVFGDPGLGMDYLLWRSRGGRLGFISSGIDQWNTPSFGMVPMAIIQQTSGYCWLVWNWITGEQFWWLNGGNKAIYIQQFWLSTMNSTRQTISLIEGRFVHPRNQILLREGSCNNQNAL